MAKKVYKFGVRRHRSTLAESLKTTKWITEEEYFKLLPKYHYYGYDERCNQSLFILKDMGTKDNFDSPTWLFVEIITL